MAAGRKSRIAVDDMLAEVDTSEETTEYGTSAPVSRAAIDMYGNPTWYTPEPKRTDVGTGETVGVAKKRKKATPYGMKTRARGFDKEVGVQETLLAIVEDSFSMMARYASRTHATAIGIEERLVEIEEEITSAIYDLLGGSVSDKYLEQETIELRNEVAIHREQLRTLRANNEILSAENVQLKEQARTATEKLAALSTSIRGGGKRVRRDRYIRGPSEVTEKDMLSLLHDVVYPHGDAGRKRPPNLKSISPVKRKSPRK